MLRLIWLIRGDDCVLGPCRMHRSSQAARRGVEKRGLCDKEKHKVLECLEPGQSEEGQVCLEGGWVRSGSTWKPCLRSRQGKILEGLVYHFEELTCPMKDGYLPNEGRVAARHSFYAADSGDRLGATGGRKPG